MKTQFQDFSQWLAALAGTCRSPDKQVGISKSPLFAFQQCQLSGWLVHWLTGWQEGPSLTPLFLLPLTSCIPMILSVDESNTKSDPSAFLGLRGCTSYACKCASKNGRRCVLVLQRSLLSSQPVKEGSWHISTQ